jgi:hypothetical protein
MSRSISIVLSKKVSPSMLMIAEECVKKAVNWCGEKYNFSAEEALRNLGVMSVSIDMGKKSGKKVGEKVAMSKAAFPLPYNGEMNENCCSALRQNNGLYTQCTGGRRGESPFCKGCASQMQKTGAEIPEYGTIEMRKAVGIFEYVDPKGRKPVAYTKVMKKYKLTEEQVLEEAKKMNMVINEEHFVAPEKEGVKRGRPKSSEKEPKEKGTRGRPKKTKQVVEIDGDTEDLFATLVANANEDVKSEDEDMQSVKSEDVKKAAKEALAKQKKEEEKAAKEALAKQKKEEKELAAEQAKKEKELAKEAEKAAKEAAKKEKELAAEQAKKEKELAKEAAKKEKELAAEQAKKEKEAKLAAKASKEKVSKKSEKKSGEKEAEEQADEEPDVVKKIEFEGKKYLKSKKTGIIYDYTEYTKNGEQVVIGKWNDSSNKIDFNAAEEEEEEYDM